MKNATSDYGTLAAVRESLLRNYFKDSAYLSTELGSNDLAAHLEVRLEDDRLRVIPWLEAFCPLAGARVLEIGCGTGSSTLALAERGAHVTAIDILPDSVRVAEDRCRAYGQVVDFSVMNAAEVSTLFSRGQFDMIVFYAALEHMTHEERRTAMQHTWEMTDPGKFWVVIETPNRLWFRDDHTSLLPFFHWLPDTVAFEYSKFSTRDYFRELYLEHTPEKELHFLRRGRGVSFHEFELFLAPRQQLDIVSSMPAYFRGINPGELQRWLESDNGAYEALMQRVLPDLHPGFLQPYLDLMIRKNP